jgi:hypothetical protein
LKLPGFVLLAWREFSVNFAAVNILPRRTQRNPPKLAKHPMDQGEDFTTTAIQARSQPDSCRPLIGMQKDELTMFARTCYSSLVPRVHPGLLCAVRFAAVCRELAVELLRKAFPDEVRFGNFPR